ncbi:hypothetical protein DFJ58DRAFT_727485 [Suillus subalutaceus]|uniref:uncharacterized protein n=1 Tax=Suillus subalutaceus TaxID=48586 RepID=UPI001B87B36F|nr:uncharacterized protein DFJ58DRAFT_727485 [Suillus subalutaceus]KAG1855668.1 hypothetical protein DFJ58DRAFT_727485 [Suillus subalutaceus]
MNAPVDSLGMPLRTYSAAPRFGGDYTQLVNFLESVERLAQPLGLSDKDIIKYALKYTAPNERELFSNVALSAVIHALLARNPLFRFRLEAHHEAPLVGAPQQPEHALDQPAVAVMAPVHETRETIPLPPTPASPIIEIAFAPAHIEAPIVGEPTELQSDPEDQLDEVVLPQQEVQAPTAIANALNAPLEEIASPIINNDLKPPSHFSAPIQEHSAVPELQNAPYLDQSLSLVNPLVTDNTVHIACSAFSDFRLPVKHPCITSPTHHIDHVSGDPDAPPVHPMAPEIVQFARLEAMYIQPSPFSPFSLVSHFSLSRSFLSVANTLLSPSIKLTIIPSLRRHSRAPNALILTPKAPIITPKFSLDRVFTTLSLLNRIPCIHHDLYFNQPFRRDLGACLACTHPPTASIITINFTSFVLIRIFRVFAYHVHITFSFSIKHQPFMTKRLWRLDKSSILIICALFAPNLASYSSFTNAFSVYQPILANPEDIIIFAPKCANVPASPAAYHAVVHLYYPRLASPWRAPNRRHQVQEFIPPVTSPPPSRHLFHSAPSGTWFGHGLDHFLNTQFRLPHLGYHWTFASSPSLHYAMLTRHTRHSRLSRTSAHLRRLKRECSRALHSTFTPHSHHQPSIVIMSSHPYAILKSRYHLNTAFAHFRFISANVPTLRAPMTPYSRAYTHHSRLIAVISISFRQLSPSHPQAFDCVCTHQSHFAHSAVLPRFHAPMTPYACASPAPSAPLFCQSRLITFASDTLAVHSSRITYPHHNFA